MAPFESMKTEESTEVKKEAAPKLTKVEDIKASKTLLEQEKDEVEVVIDGNLISIAKPTLLPDAEKSYDISNSMERNQLIGKLFAGSKIGSAEYFSRFDHFMKEITESKKMSPESLWIIINSVRHQVEWDFRNAKRGEAKTQDQYNAIMRNPSLYEDFIRTTMPSKYDMLFPAKVAEAAEENKHDLETITNNILQYKYEALTPSLVALEQNKLLEALKDSDIGWDNLIKNEKLINNIISAAIKLDGYEGSWDKSPFLQNNQNRVLWYVVKQVYEQLLSSTLIQNKQQVLEKYSWIFVQNDWSISKENQKFIKNAIGKDWYEVFVKKMQGWVSIPVAWWDVTANSSNATSWW